MIESLLRVLPVCIYFLLIVLIVILIIIGIKFIYAMNKFDRIADNVERKINSFNGFFDILDSTTSRISGVYDKAYSLISGVFSKIIDKRKEKKEDYE